MSTIFLDNILSIKIAILWIFFCLYCTYLIEAKSVYPTVPILDGNSEVSARIKSGKIDIIREL